MSRSRNETILDALLGSCAIGVISIVVAIAGFVTLEALPAILRIGVDDFVGDSNWYPKEGRYGVLPMLIASLIIAFGALVVATPLGVASALFSQSDAPRFVRAGFRRALVVASAIPSVVFGLWGLSVLVPRITELRPPGASLAAGIVVLSLMILPTIALLVDTALQARRNEHRGAARALGMSSWSALVFVVLPSAFAGVRSAVLIGLARALGETMAVVMVCGNVVQVPASLFDPVRTLTANIALEMSYAMDVHRSALFASGLLLVIVAALLALAAGPWTEKGADA